MKDMPSVDAFFPGSQPLCVCVDLAGIALLVGVSGDFPFFSPEHSTALFSQSAEFKEFALQERQLPINGCQRISIRNLCGACQLCNDSVCRGLQL